LSEQLVFSRNHWLKKDNDVPTFIRPLSVYVNMLAKSGLFISSLVEPLSITEYLGKKVKSRIPFKIGIQAIKV
jgi:hypothetical protein